MAVGCLKAARDALIFAHAENIMDDEEFYLPSSTGIQSVQGAFSALEI